MRKGSSLVAKAAGSDVSLALSAPSFLETELAGGGVGILRVNLHSAVRSLGRGAVSAKLDSELGIGWGERNCLEGFGFGEPE